MKIKNLTAQGKGISKNHHEKTVFVENALWNEEVTEYQTTFHKKNYEEAVAIAIKPHTISPFRAKPACPDFNNCGGCSLQHIDFQAQTALKQRGLEENIRFLGKVVTSYQRLSPIAGMEKHYRHRARVHFFQTATEIQIGFQTKRNNENKQFILPKNCTVLEKNLRDYITYIHSDLNQNSDLFDKKPEQKKGLKASIHLSWDSYNQQIGVFFDFHHKPELSHFINKLQQRILTATSKFEENNQQNIKVQLRFQKNTESIQNFKPLIYQQTDDNILIEYDVLDFTQVNPVSNQILIRQALKLLQLQADDIVIDFFCGLGNFTLPIAKRTKFVHGIEGVATQVEKAKNNAIRNNLQHNTSFAVGDLFVWKPEDVIDLQKQFQANKWLLDPPRDGAFELIKALADVSLISPEILPKTLVYVSCDHATLSRDIRVLTKHGGYTLISAGALNVFPHTAHVESIALLTRE